MGIKATHELVLAWSENDTASSEYSFAEVTTIRTRHNAAQKFTNVLKLDHSILQLPSSTSILPFSGTQGLIKKAPFSLNLSNPLTWVPRPNLLQLCNITPAQIKQGSLNTNKCNYCYVRNKKKYCLRGFEKLSPGWLINFQERAGVSTNFFHLMMNGPLKLPRV